MKKIPSRDQFKSLPKERQKEAIKELRKNFPDKDIRESWNMTTGGFYQMLRKFDLSSKNTDMPPTRKQDSNNSNSNYIDAEFIVVDDDKNKKPSHQQLANISSTPEPETISTYLPFPPMKGTTRQLRKQFEAVALFLEGHEEDEETKFEITLSIIKK